MSVFAPDEGEYTDIIGFVKSGGNWVSYQLGYGAGFWPEGCSLLVPALGLMYAGVAAIDALRIVSVVYSTGSALLLLTILWIAMRRGRFPSTAAGPRLVSWPMLRMIVFQFLPSHALWNTLALREAATEFGTIAAVAFAFPLGWWQKALVGAGIALAIAVAFQSRGSMAVALSLALACAVLWFGRERPRFSLVVAAAVLVGTTFGLALSLPAEAPVPKPDTSSAANSTQPPGTSVFDSLRRGVTAAPSRLNPDTYLQRGSYQREVSAQYADSAIATDSCSGLPDPRNLRVCEISRLPGAAFAVMFRPLWPLDMPKQWSALAFVASIENIAWLMLALAAAYVSIRRGPQLTRVLFICLVYGGLLVAGMAALEGNFGTAFRHKSNVLWVVVIIFILAGIRRRSTCGETPVDGASRTMSQC